MVLRWPQDKDFPLLATRVFQFRFTRGHGHGDAWQEARPCQDKDQRQAIGGVGVVVD